MKKPAKDAPPAAVAYSYVRFSHPSQAEGDSLRRQTEAAAAWCQRNGARLDAATTYRDLGKSAYTGAHRQNPDRHALAAFLKLVEAGKVPRGSYLILENLDRLSREHIQPALLLALNLLQSGVRLVQLRPAETVFDDKSDTMPVMMMMMELSRGHGESAIKSERVGAAWERKRRVARDGGELLTLRLPAWVEAHGGAPRLVPARAAVVKQIFALAATGYGTSSIVKKFNREKVAGFGPSGEWSRQYVNKILKDRRAVGEFQPRTRGEKPDGAPIAGYFPAAVTEREWDAARGGAAERRQKPGRVGTSVNVFAGLTFDARDGGTYVRKTQIEKRGPAAGRRSVLENTRGMDGLAKSVSFPFDVFETALLSMLREVDPHEVLNGDSGPDETLALAGELAGVEAKIAELEAELLGGDVSALARVLRGLEGRKRGLVARLAEARQKAASPLSEAWGEAQSLAGILAAAPDPEDCRLRLRSALRKVVDPKAGIRMLVVPRGRGRGRLCAVQVWFSPAGCGRHRDYLILYSPAAGNGAGYRREESWEARSLADVAALGPLDLRQPSHAKRLEAALLAADLPPAAPG